MQYPAYIPAPDSLFAIWLANFAVQLTASPGSFELVAGDAVIVASAQASFQGAYDAATNPATRNTATIADKDAQRANAESIVRPYAVQIIRNSAVTNQNRVVIGVTVPKTVPTPVPAPVTAPALILSSANPLLHNLQYRDATDPLVKAKPFGVLHLQLWAQIGITAGIDPDAAAYVGGFGKSPFQVSWQSGDRGKHATYWSRWVTRSGPAGVPQVGPWSTPLDVIII